MAKLSSVYYVNDYTNENNKKKYYLNENDPKLRLLDILIQFDEQSNEVEIDIIFKKLLKFLRTNIKDKTRFKNMDKLYYFDLTTKNGEVHKMYGGTILNFLTYFIHFNYNEVIKRIGEYTTILLYFLYIGSLHVFDGETFLPIMMFFRIVNLPHIPTIPFYNRLMSEIMNFNNEQIMKLPQFEKTVRDILNATYNHDDYPNRIRTQHAYRLRLTKGYTLLQFLIQNNFKDQVKELFTGRPNDYIDLNKNNPFFTALIYFDKNSSENAAADGAGSYIYSKYIQLFFETTKNFDINQYGTSDLGLGRMTSFMKLLELYDKYVIASYTFRSMINTFLQKKNIKWDLRKGEEDTPILLFYLTNQNSVVSQYLNSEEKFNFFKNNDFLFLEDNNHSKFYISVQMYKTLFDKGGKQLFTQTDKNGFSVLVFLLHLNLKLTGNNEIDKLIQCFRDSIKKNKKLVKKDILELIKNNKLIEGKTINGTKININRILYQSTQFKIFDSDDLFDLLYNINNDDDDVVFQILKSLLKHVNVDSVIDDIGETFRTRLLYLKQDSDTERNRFLNNMNIKCLRANKRYFNLYSTKLHELWNIITNYEDYEVFLDNYKVQQIKIKNVLSDSLEYVDIFMFMNDLTIIDINKIQPEYFYTYELPLPYDIIDDWESYEDVNWNINKNKKEKIYNDLKNLVKKPEYVVDTAAFEELF